MKKRDNKERKAPDTKLLGYLLIETVAVMLLFSVCVYGVGSVWLGKIVYFAYLILGVALLVAAVGLNGGFDTEVPSPDDITGNLSLSQREAFVEKIKVRKAWAKKVLFFDFPFLLCLLLDTIYVMLPTGGPF